MTRPGSVARALTHDLALRIRRPPSDLRDLPPLAVWDRYLLRVLPIVFAVSTGLQISKYIAVPEGVGFDARLYTAAAREWLAGGDPWSVTRLGIPFGAPPPTLLAYVPFTPLPDWLVVQIWVIGSFALAALAIRAIGFRWWWICFWPIVDGALVGNPDVVVLALLVIARRYIGGVAPVLKVYAMLPLIAERRWRSIAAFGLVLLITLPVLPWALWVADLPSISLALERTAATTSVSGNLFLVLIGIAALLALGWRRAGWLAVPVLWPWTQPHYLAMSTPALTPMLAMVWCIPNPPPLAILGSIIVAAIGFHLFPHVESPRDSDLRAERVGSGVSSSEPVGRVSFHVTALPGSP